MAVAIVVVEDGLSVAGDEQVNEAVVVIVGRGHGDPVEIGRKTRLLRHVGKVAVAVVAVEMIVRQRIRLLLERIRMH